MKSRTNGKKIKLFSSLPSKGIQLFVESNWIHGKELHYHVKGMQQAIRRSRNLVLLRPGKNLGKKEELGESSTRWPQRRGTVFA